jgi:dethiobiotin synthetase
MLPARQGESSLAALFITGTGTDIGKTWLACALLRHWRAAGRRPLAFKPLLSGFDASLPEASDAGQILSALGRDMGELDAIAPWRFAAPLSPNMAAALEGKPIDFDALVDFTRRVAHADACPTLIEGVGGVMAPLTVRQTVRDWIAASGLPCVLVAGSYLGSLSHTLTALEALTKVGVAAKAIVVNESAGSAVELDAVIENLMCHAPGIAVHGIPRAAPGSAVARLADWLLSA